MPRRGRLLGPVALEALRYASWMGAVTAIDIAHGLRLSRRDAVRVLYQLRAAGYMRPVSTILQPPSRRPVVVCEAVVIDRTVERAL